MAKDKSDLRNHNREKMKKWRANPENKKQQNERRRILRDQNIEIIRLKEKEYYKKNRSHILKKAKEYQSKNPEVKKKAQEKAKELGRGIEKGKKERNNLNAAYVAAQIRKEKTNKSIETKRAEILIYRIKKLIKKYE